MGLDMYLEAEEYISRPVDWMTDEAKAKLVPRYEALVKLLPGTPSDRGYGVTVSYIVAYWRKANAIHKWFVDNCQDGVDECQRTYVTREQLNELLSVCREVIKVASTAAGDVINGYHSGPDTGHEMVPNIEQGKIITNPDAVAALLPSAGGFFFGSTDYDEYYLDDVRDTINQIQAVLAQYQGKDRVSFYYQSSW